MDTGLGRDFSLALRGLRRTPGFTATTIGTLAIGLSLALASSAVARAYLLDPLPAPSSDRLYHVWYAGQPGPHEPRGLRLLDWRALSAVVEVADASMYARLMLADGPSARELTGLRVSEASRDTLGLETVLGRTFSADDFASAEPPIVLGHHFWLERFGGRADVLGATLRLAATGSTGPPSTYRVIGVATPGFRYVREFARPPVDVVTTLPAPGTAYMVRLHTGVPPETAAQQITDAIRSTPGIVPPGNWPGVRLESVHDRHIAPIRPVLSAVWVASVCVLALVAANVAILVLLRSLRRRREAAIRIALGAGRTHVRRSLALEGGIVAIAAVTLGVIGATLALEPLHPMLTETLGRAAPWGGSSLITLDAAIGIVALMVIMVIGWTAMGGLAIRQDASSSLRETRSMTDRPAIRWAGTGFMVIQAAASIALLTGCALMIRSATGLLTVDLGITIDDAWRTRVALPASAFPDAPAQQSFYERLVRAADDQGITVGLANWPLFVEAARPQDIEVSGGPGRTVRAAVTSVTAGYLEVLGIPVVDGRALDVTDRQGAEPVALVSAAFAVQTWPGLRAIGQRIRTVDAMVAGEPFGEWRTVVGVVDDVRQMPDDDDRHDIYVPFLQRVPPLYAVVVLKARSGVMTPADLTDRFDAISGRVDARAVTGAVTSLATEFDRLVATPRLLAFLLSGFGLFATILTMVGVYGTTAHAVKQREAELAIRMALGASRPQIASLLLGTAVIVLTIGGAAGIAGSAGLGRLLSTHLFHVGSFDVGLTAGVVAATAVCLVVASAIPIRRATRIAPARLLRDL